MDSTSWVEEETPLLPTDDDAPPEFEDPAEGIHPGELTDHERHIYEAGFMAGYAIRNQEVAQLDHDADRLYRAAFDHRNCACWKGHRGIIPNGNPWSTMKTHSSAGIPDSPGQRCQCVRPPARPLTLSETQG